MIQRVTLRNFKRFEEQVFDLADSVVLAGPNNAGKSTLLQAIATWKFGLDRWVARRQDGSSAVKRTGVAITRNDFTTVPLREMNLLWKDRRVSGGDGPGASRFIEIEVAGIRDGVTWECGLEFQYHSREMVYVRPLGAKRLGGDDISRFPPKAAVGIEVVHVPPLSGIQRDEPLHARGMQDLLVGQGRSGELLRNLLLGIHQSGNEDWHSLAGHVRDLFQIDLLKPVYGPGQPFIVCEYTEAGQKRPLDIANAGSGALQVLLLLAFLYARPGTVMLLDEPDAHQHIMLQKEVYVLVQKVARKRRGQAIIATHSEVILDATAPERVLAFIGDVPRALATDSERDKVREALKRLTTTDLLLGREAGAVLYVEGGSDERILREWARVLDHPAQRFLERPFVHWLGGRRLQEAKAHHFALWSAFPNVRALCLLDGDNIDDVGEQTTRLEMVVLRWRRYEIENYLLHPDAIKRFVELPLMQRAVEVGFADHVPPAAELIGDHVALVRVKASDEFLVPLLEHAGRPTPKRDLHLLAALMKPEEIHPEVIEKLDRIAEVLNSPRSEAPV